MTQDLCRVCLNPSSDPVYLAYFSYKNGISFTEIFTQITEVFLYEGVLCRICEKRLLDAYEFRCQAQEAELVWRKTELTAKHEEIMLQEEYLDPEPNESDFSMKQEVPDSSEIYLIEEKQHKKKIVKTSQCRYCLEFISEKLYEHEQFHIIQNEGLECHHCHKKYSSRKRISEHLKCVHFNDKSDRPRFNCDICGKSYSEKSSLRAHKRDVHSDNPRLKTKEICPLCGKKACHLRKHIDTVHKNLISGYCDICGKGFKSKASLANHLKYLHLGIRSVQCNICSKFYRNHHEVDMHIKRVHISEQKYECKTCGKKFKTEASHRVHVRLHQTDFDFQCDICMARFKTKHYMLAHQKVHSDTKEFQCNVCSMGFKRSGQLTKHLRKHTGEFFNCDLCPGVGFIDKYSLSEHKDKVHYGVRYRCDICGKVYKSKKHMRHHQKVQAHDINAWSKLFTTNEEILCEQETEK